MLLVTFEQAIRPLLFRVIYYFNPYFISPQFYYTCCHPPQGLGLRFTVDGYISPARFQSYPFIFAPHPGQNNLSNISPLAIPEITTFVSPNQNLKPF
jgi:hypothetical protein